MNVRLLTILLILITVGARLHAKPGDGEIDRAYGFESGLSSSIIGGAVQDSNGLLWFATWAGLHCYDGYDFHRVQIHPGDSASIGTDHILDIRLSDEGNILCHTEGDVYEFDLSEFRFKDIPADKKDSLLKSMGKTWTGLTDRQGNRWTSDNNGLQKRSPVHHPASVVEGTAGLHPRCFLTDTAGRLWIGTRSDRSVLILNPDGTVYSKETLPGAPYVLYQTGNGDIWAGCKPGSLMKYGGASITDDAIYDIREDRQGRLWVATFGNGIRCCANPHEPKPTLSDPFETGKVRQLLITPANNIVAATTEGVLTGHIDDSDYRNTRFRRIKRDGNNPGSLYSNATMCVGQDSNGNIYIATESSGIDVISEDELFGPAPMFRHINTRTSALTDDVIKAMTLQSDSLLMIVGNDHVTAYNPATGSSVNLSRTFWSDTCHMGEASPLMLPDGSWIFGAEEGAFIATTHNIHSRGYVPPVVFTTLAINGEDADFRLVPCREISLAEHQRNVTIGFVAIDYADNENILYRSRIDGSPWTAATRSRSVTLFNLSPGSHILEVQSTDRYGRSVDNSRILNINVAAYWHETLWAKIMAALLLTSVITLAVYTCFHISALHRQRRELLEKYMTLIGNAGASGKTPTYEIAQAGVKTKPEDTAFLNRVRKYIEENISNPDANVDDMATAAAASRSTLNRRLRSQLGISASQLLAEARMKRAEELIGAAPARHMSMADIAAECGYTDVYYFQRVLRQRGINI